jgi:hypothetical protein
MLVQVQYTPDTPTTIPFDDKRFKKGSKDLPIDQPPLVKVTSEDEPEQVHIALAGPLALLPMPFSLHPCLLAHAMHNCSCLCSCRR